MGVIRPGLVSVTFRALDPAGIVALAVEAALTGIEWGGDIHVPHGDLATARRVGAMTIDAGLVVAAYGSYYRAGSSTGENPTFEAVLETAAALGAPTIRVWAGRLGSAEVDGSYRRAIVDDARRIADLAAATGITVAFEYHQGTLTDTAESTHQLLTEVDHPHVRTLWQPPVGVDTQRCLAGLKTIRPWLANLHVFHWWPTETQRLPLADGAERWRRYLDIAAADSRDRFALLEFVRGDDPACLLRDARVLRGLVTSGSAPTSG
jgi:3-dehydroshikimate dehydratase